MRPMLLRTIIYFTLLGWILSPSPPVAARENLWLNAMFFKGKEVPGGDSNGIRENTADKIASSAIAGGSSSSSEGPASTSSKSSLPLNSNLGNPWIAPAATGDVDSVMGSRKTYSSSSAMEVGGTSPLNGNGSSDADGDQTAGGGEGLPSSIDREGVNDGGREASISTVDRAEAGPYDSTDGSDGSSNGGSDGGSDGGSKSSISESNIRSSDSSSGSMTSTSNDSSGSSSSSSNTQIISSSNSGGGGGGGGANAFLAVQGRVVQSGAPDNSTGNFSRSADDGGFPVDGNGTLSGGGGGGGGGVDSGGDGAHPTGAGDGSSPPRNGSFVNGNGTQVSGGGGGGSGGHGGAPSPLPEEEDWGPPDEDCPRVNLTTLAKTCFVLRRICVHQETMVTHDWRYAFANPKRSPLPEIPYVENWNFPAAMGTNSDALHGRGPRYRLHLRTASSHEPTAALRNPIFSNCTLPLVMVVDFPYNMGEFFAKVLTAVDRMHLDDRVTLVLATPMGLNLAAFHSLFLMPYSRYPAITAAELGSRGCDDPRVGAGSKKLRCDPPRDGAGDEADGGCHGGAHRAVPWSSEPVQPHCFQRMIMCQWDLSNGGGSPLAMVGSRVVSALVSSGLLPPSPVRFTGGGSHSSSSISAAAVAAAASDRDRRGTTTLRVLIESRTGLVRNIKNLEELLAACKERDRAGFTAGPFRRLACASTSFSETDGSVDRERFLSNVAAVRSAHVLVVFHGAGASNSWFMRQGSSALVELRPCAFGTHFSPWPDKYMPKQHEKNDDVIRFFALNIEDQDQCLKGDIEASLRNHTTRKDNVGWDASYFARDQHLQLKPGPFLEFLRHVGELMLDVDKYRASRDADKLHGYVVPNGLMYGKLGITKLLEYMATENPEVIPV